MNNDHHQEPNDPFFGLIFQPSDVDCLKLLYYKKHVDQNFTHTDIKEKDVYEQKPHDWMDQAATKYFFCLSNRANRFMRSVEEKGFWKQIGVAVPIKINASTLIGYKVNLGFRNNKWKKGHSDNEFAMEEFCLHSDVIQDVFTFNKVYSTKGLNTTTKFTDVDVEHDIVGGDDDHLLIDPLVANNPYFGQIFNPTSQECIKLLHYKRFIDTQFTSQYISSVDIFDSTTHIEELLEDEGTTYYFFSESDQRGLRSYRPFGVIGIWEKKGKTIPIMDDNRTLPLGFKANFTYEREGKDYHMEEFWLATDGLKCVFTFNKLWRNVATLTTTEKGFAAQLDNMLSADDVDELDSLVKRDGSSNLSTTKKRKQV